MNKNINCEEVPIQSIDTLKNEIEYLKKKYNREITNHKSAVDALIASETRYRRLFETAQDGILILDAETGKIVDVNPFLIDLLGYSKEEFIEKEIWEIGFLKDIIANKEKFDELQQKGYVRYEDLPLERIDGRKINVEFVSNVYLVNNYKVIQCNIRDITERKIAEQLLLKSEERFKNIFNNAPIGIYRTNKVGDIILANPKLVEILGFSTLEELQKRNIGTEGYKSPNDRDKFIEEIEANGFVNNFEVIWKKLNGEEIHINEYARSVCDIDGKILFYEGTVEDVSEKKNVEKKLIIAKERAEESDNLKSAFLQNLSHEIRTPLNGILGFSGLLNSDDLSLDEIQEFTALISHSGRRLVELIENILEISKIQTGQIQIDLSPISINTLLTDLLISHQSLAAKKNINIKYLNQDEEIGLINTDGVRLNQILTILLNNALKFTNSGYIEFGYSIIKPMILFFVKDSGIGIPKDCFQKIFESFIQAELSLSSGYEGAGLGLAISKGLLKYLGGVIWVESEVNVGSTFYFTIPYVTTTNLN